MFRRDLQELAESKEASEQIRADWQTATAWTGAGEWAVKLTEVDGRMHLGTGMHINAPEDRTPGGIYRLEMIAGD